MASILRAPSIFPSPVVGPTARSASAPAVAPLSFSFWRRTSAPPRRLKLAGFAATRTGFSPPPFLPCALAGDAIETEVAGDAATREDPEDKTHVENGGKFSGANDTEDKHTSVLAATFHSYKQALAGDDQPKISEIEAFLQSIAEEKISLEKQVGTLSKDLSVETDRVLRISADFDNFRKRTERERLSLMSDAQGDVLESLLPVLDSFERARAQIKVETEGEVKMSSSYQNIYKQMVEILKSLGVEYVETVGKEFDPLLHEAITREESSEFDEGVIIQEFRKGFQIGNRLLRPSMVKVSSGPGPAKPEALQVPEIEGLGTNPESPSLGGGS